MKCTWIFHKGQILCPSPKQIVWQSSSWSESNQCSDASYFHCHSSLCKLQPPQTTSFTRTGIHDCMDILIECGCMIICTHTYIYIYMQIYIWHRYVYIYIHTGIYIYIYHMYLHEYTLEALFFLLPSITEVSLLHLCMPWHVCHEEPMPRQLFALHQTSLGWPI